MKEEKLKRCWWEIVGLKWRSLARSLSSPENIWFVWSKTKNRRENVGCRDCDNRRQNCEVSDSIRDKFTIQINQIWISLLQELQPLYIKTPMSIEF